MINLFKKYKIKDMIIYLLYIPRIVFSLDNWLQYLKSYNSPFLGVIKFRNGLKLKLNEPVDTSTISVIFFEREYGTVKDGSVVLDIGANRGYFSVYAANSGRNIKVYSFEPINNTYKSLLQNIKLNNLQNKIIPFNMGVAGSDAVREFSITSPISNSMVF